MMLVLFSALLIFLIDLSAIISGYEYRKALEEQFIIYKAEQNATTAIRRFKNSSGEERDKLADEAKLALQNLKQALIQSIK